MGKSKLIIGHAGKDHPEAKTLDIDPVHQPDGVHDIQKVPGPFKPDIFQEIVAQHVLEHVRDLAPIMEEMHRICRPGGQIKIEVPTHTAWLAYDPAHYFFLIISLLMPIFCKEKRPGCKGNNSGA